MDWSLIPWSAIVAVIGMVVGFIVWLVRLEGKTASNRRETEITNERVGMVNARVGATETLLAEVRATAITKTDLREVEERVTRSVDAVGTQVTGEIDRLIRVIEKPSTRRSGGAN